MKLIDPYNLEGKTIAKFIDGYNGEIVIFFTDNTYIRRCKEWYKYENEPCWTWSKPLKNAAEYIGGT